MEVRAVLPPKGRDLRLDFYRGIANWAIFLDHIPDNAVNWITTRNFGFSDAADLFVFISGYTAAFVYANIMLSRGFFVGATRLTKRVWQLYVAHVMLLVIYVAAIGHIAQMYFDPDILNEFNIAVFIINPIDGLREGLLLGFKPVNLDVLPLYIVLMGFFPPVLWLMLRRPDWVMLGSLVLYFAARHYGWNLPAYPAGQWYFNPFTWQLLFIFGAWFALGGARESQSIIHSPALVYIGVAYLLFALVMTLGARLPSIGELLPVWLYDAFIPNDKTNLAPYRVLHFVIIALLATRFVPKTWVGLEWPIMQPIIKCGQQSLAVFCVGIFLSFVGHVLLTMSSGSLLVQITVSAAGIVILCGVAYYLSWSKKQDKPRAKPAPTDADNTAAPSASQQ